MSMALVAWRRGSFAAPMLLGVLMPVVQVDPNDIVGELQNGFQIDRRLDDNLFILTHCIAISKIKRPLYVAYLDITGMYDNVNQEILGDILKEVGRGDACIQLLREI